MAVVLIEGFDHLTAAEMTAKGWATTPSSMQPGRFDGQSARCTNAAFRIKTLPSTYTTLICGLAFRTSAVGTASNFFELLHSGTVIASLGLDTAGHITVKNSAGTTIATGTTVLTTGAWYYVELKLFVNTGTPASGTCEVHLGGATEISSTAGNFGSSTIDSLGYSALNIGGSTGDFDDMYAVDTTGSSPRNTFLGDVRVETLYPTADGTHTAWTPNSGTTHFSQVDEAQADGDTSYVSDSTPGDIDTYVMGDIDTGATVFGVQTNHYARKDDANTRQIAPVIRQSGTDNVGTTVTLTSSYVDYTQIYNQDPTSSDWTPTTVNADEFGVKEIA